MDTITADEIRSLAQVTDDPCVSIYLPTHRRGRETTQDALRLKNLLAQAHSTLTDAGYRNGDAMKLLAPAAALPDDRPYWTHLDEGLALFLSPSGGGMYRLPAQFEDLVNVADHFHLKPLFPVTADSAVFYVLALSKNGVRLLRGTRFSATEIELDGTPGSLSEALQFSDRERQVQSHAAGRVGSGRVTAGFHGSTTDKDTDENDLLYFFRAVDTGLHKAVGDDHIPLVLAGVGYLLPLFRRASRYPAIVDHGIEGNPEHLSCAELRDRAWDLVAPLFDKQRDEACNRFLTAGTLTADALSHAVVAAHQGRVETMFVAQNTQRWGVFDPETLRVVEHDERRARDRDLLDIAAVDTLTHGGQVFALETCNLPAHPVAAILRY